MKCPFCDCHDTRVIDSRDSPDGAAIRRRRQCVACAKRFTTHERFEMPELRVRKRDGRIVDFERDKLEVGVIKACEKRPISRRAIVELVDGIEEDLRALGEPVVPTTEIGALILEGLKGLDQVAYIRFASVYKEFMDASHFEAEVRELRQGTLDESAAVILRPSREAGD